MAEIVVKSISDYIDKIQKEIEKDINKVLIDMAEDVKNILYIYTYNFYERYEPDPESYIRTYEFINSLMVRFISDKEVEIGFDSTKMSVKPNQRWIQHEDRFHPLSQIINDGWEYRQDGSEALDKAIEYMNSNLFKREVSDTFKKYGYNLI